MSKLAFMRMEILEDALLSALSLLQDEIESVSFDELRAEYQVVIDKIENGLKEISTNG